MKLSLIVCIAVAVAAVGCAKPEMVPGPTSAPEPCVMSPGLHVSVDKSHCRESQHQPLDSFVSLVCIADNQMGAVGVLLTLEDWAALRK